MLFKGAENSLRNKKDGITYFGCKKNSNTENDDEESEALNDVVIPSKDGEVNERHLGRHFQIEYSPEVNRYRIRDLGIGFGAFVKIDHPLILRDNNLLSMGSSFLIMNFSEDYKDSLGGNSNSREVHDSIKFGNQMPKNTTYQDVVLINSSIFR